MRYRAYGNVAVRPEAFAAEFIAYENECLILKSDEKGGGRANGAWKYEDEVARGPPAR